MKNKNINWEKIVEKTRKEVVSKFPQLYSSLDFGAYIEADNYFVSYIFHKNDDLKEAENSGLTKTINQYHMQRMEVNGYPIDAINDCYFASQEECEKMYNGNWYYYYK
ncbi:hypothetical protein H0486_11415 [Lachnospiraceae bacterium MD1]|uniref:Uncharacterized protein n=1 Tax=Variimorphobacter saccharofermentans TaxID=2755051 RepID=A0A839K257_9FIRM|nr:hypothetical protein [Variimorphobacter saccharofermentans]MBB2183488.1 hypothetical protein [Variimorphobacter saccharofermentans]